VPIGVSVWRIEAGKAVAVARTPLANEKLLEDILDADVGMLGLPPLLVIGRQVITKYEGRVDLLCIDQEGTLYVIEIKKDRTPREVVAQAMDYGSWVSNLGSEDVIALYAKHHDGSDFVEAFRSAFEVDPPEAVNVRHKLVIVAASLDSASERIVTYAQGFGLPLNAVFFQAFAENGTQYLTRAWLIDPTEQVPTPKASQAKRLEEKWNGKDWYANFGEDDTRNWEDARRYGFVSAGGGPVYSRALRNLPEGGRVFVAIPRRGYVGVGIVIGTAIAGRDFRVDVDEVEVPIVKVALHAPNLTRAVAQGDEETEWFVPVSWVKTVPASEAIYFKGLYGNPNTVTKLTRKFTRDIVLEKLGISEDALELAAGPRVQTPVES
jgi:hypothetical protein